MGTLTSFHRCALLFLPVIILMACRGDAEQEKTAPKPVSVETKIRNFAESWIGTPYELGGTSREGIDCSALTQKLYKEVFQIELPRRVVDQRDEGLQIARDSLKAGDLVVFRSQLLGRPHVGVYISDGDFVNASSSKGVTISNLSEYYWNKKFRFGRRLIDPHGKLIPVPDK